MWMNIHIQNFKKEEDVNAFVINELKQKRTKAANFILKLFQNTDKYKVSWFGRKLEQKKHKTF